MEASTLHVPVAFGRLATPAPLLRLRSDDQLVALFRAGSDEAFRVIHDRYRQRLFAYMRQMLAGSRQDAEDALQDVFIRAYGALRANGRPISLRAWLYRVAHNRCIDQLRRPAPAAEDIFEVSRTPLHDPLLEVERHEELRRLIDDVRALPDQQRSALLMRELQGLSYDELSQALSVSVPAVKSLLVRARIGLVDAAEARSVGCGEIRAALVDASDRGVRASGKARRHMRECDRCRAYRAQLRQVRSGLGALAPTGPFAPLGLLAKLGLSGSGAAAGGAGASGGIVGGGVAITSAAKVVIVCCAAAVTAGGAYEVDHALAPPPPQHAGAREAPSAASAGAASSAAAAIAIPTSPAVTGGTRAPAPAADRAAQAQTAPGGQAPAAVMLRRTDHQAAIPSDAAAPTGQLPTTTTTTTTTAKPATTQGTTQQGEGLGGLIGGVLGGVKPGVTTGAGGGSDSPGSGTTGTGSPGTGTTGTGSSGGGGSGSGSGSSGSGSGSSSGNQGHPPNAN